MKVSEAFVNHRPYFSHLTEKSFIAPLTLRPGNQKRKKIYIFSLFITMYIS